MPPAKQSSEERKAWQKNHMDMQNGDGSGDERADLPPQQKKMRWEQLYEDSAERKLSKQKKQLEMTHRLQQEEGTHCTFKPTISFNSRWLATHLNDIPDVPQATNQGYCDTTILEKNKLNL